MEVSVKFRGILWVQVVAKSGIFDWTSRCKKPLREQLSDIYIQHAHS